MVPEPRVPEIGGSSQRWRAARASTGSSGIRQRPSPRSSVRSAPQRLGQRSQIMAFPPPVKNVPASPPPPLERAGRRWGRRRFPGQGSPVRPDPPLRQRGGARLHRQGGHAPLDVGEDMLPRPGRSGARREQCPSGARASPAGASSLGYSHSPASSPRPGLRRRATRFSWKMRKTVRSSTRRAFLAAFTGSSPVRPREAGSAERPRPGSGRTGAPRWAGRRWPPAPSWPG